MSGWQKEAAMIGTLEDVSRTAREKGPKKLAVLAPEDGEFMLAVKKSREANHIDPVLIGDPEKIRRIADEVAFDIDGVELISETDRQAVANLGTAMLFAGEVDMAGKGQIPTAYIYRAIIKEEARAGTGRNISVVSLWEIPERKRFTSFTDTGVNIRPDLKAKIEIVKNAVFVFHVLGYERPRIAVLSGKRGIGGTPASFADATALRKMAEAGDFGACEIIAATSFAEIFSEPPGTPYNGDPPNLSRLPEILVVPNLDTGNILCKLDFFLPVHRRSLVVTSGGPFIIPSRSDFCDSIMGEIAMGVVVADRMERGERR
jgi:phosphate butyryltransferase